jgi:hypothetical protein
LTPPARRLDLALNVVRVLVPLGAVAVGGWQTLLGVIVVQEIALWAAGRLSAGDAFSRRVFLAAYGIRTGIAIPVHAWRIQS